MVKIRVSRSKDTGTAEFGAANDLSPRQREMLDLISKGRSNKEIAHHLGLSVGTVKQHIAILFRKLQVNSRTKAVFKGLQIEVQEEMPESFENGENGRGAPLRVPSALKRLLGLERRPVSVAVMVLRCSRKAAVCSSDSLSLGMTRLLARAEALARDLDADMAPRSGGGVEMWFGFPSVHADDPLRAIEAGRRLLAGWREEAIEGLEAAVGIATSEAVASSFDDFVCDEEDGCGIGWSDVALAPCFDQAARLAWDVPAGQIAACEKTRTLAAGSDRNWNEWLGALEIATRLNPATYHLARLQALSDGATSPFQLAIQSGFSEPDARKAATELDGFGNNCDLAAVNRALKATILAVENAAADQLAAQ